MTVDIHYNSVYGKKLNTIKKTLHDTDDKV